MSSIILHYFKIFYKIVLNSLNLCNNLGMNERNTIKKLGGRPTRLTEDIEKLIVQTVRQYLSIQTAVDYAELPRSTVSTWITRGNKDNEEEIDSIYSKFSRALKKARSEKVQDYLRELEERASNWQSIAWTLERCCAEDFGKDAELYKQLLEDYKMLAQTVIDQNNGLNHGQKA